MERLYHIIGIDERMGSKTYMTAFAMNHDEACTMLHKFSPPRRADYRLQLEETGVHVPVETECYVCHETRLHVEEAHDTECACGENPKPIE